MWYFVNKTKYQSADLQYIKNTYHKCGIALSYLQV